MQSNERANPLNTFAQGAEAAQPEDQVIIINARDLQNVLDKAISPLLAKIEQLERLVDIYISPDPRVVDLSHEYNAQISAAAKAKAIAARDYGTKIIDCEERLNDLEASRTHQQIKKDVGKVTEARMLKLAITLLNRNNEPMSFTDVGKLLELGSRDSTSGKTTRKQNMTHFGLKLLEARERFIIHTNKQGHRFVCLTKIYKDHLTTEYMV